MTSTDHSTAALKSARARKKAKLLASLLRFSDALAAALDAFADLPSTSGRAHDVPLLIVNGPSLMLPRAISHVYLKDAVAASEPADGVAASAEPGSGKEHVIKSSSKLRSALERQLVRFLVELDNGDDEVNGGKLGIGAPLRSHKTQVLLRAPSEFSAPGWAPKRNLRLDLRGFEARTHVTVESESMVREGHAVGLSHSSMNGSDGITDTVRQRGEQSMSLSHHLDQAAADTNAMDNEEAELAALAQALSPVKRRAHVAGSNVPAVPPGSRPVLGRLVSQGSHTTDYASTLSPLSKKRCLAPPLSCDEPHHHLVGPQAPFLDLSNAPYVGPDRASSSLDSYSTDASASPTEERSAKQLLDVSTALEGLSLGQKHLSATAGGHSDTEKTDLVLSDADRTSLSDELAASAASRPSRIMPKNMRTNSLLARARLSAKSTSSSRASTPSDEHRNTSKPPKRAPPLAGGFIVDCGLSSGMMCDPEQGRSSDQARHGAASNSTGGMWFVCETVIPSFS
ncbi:hypothetical protein IE81DRAFT_344971 [Ceraceosorus guamensis]|uniref:Uncharacterized protein n=1 Tax=Ceraceosorus guamensis TaxID=1522189 RepID=A0A316WBI0_9BASI|nr:hypothetical protein IE81DRAFT_344971 [Ceraceosorus guamensis]PWN45283.1 hypothetical protein IE81DRAFT_344971 [Ceraceosorus guamensis]